MDRYKVLSTYFRISELMNVRYFGARDCANRTFPACVVTQALFSIKAEDRFPHQALLNSDHSMRAVVIMNWRFLSGPPTNDQHFDSFVSANAVTPVIAFLEPDEGLQIELGDLDF